MDVEGEVHRGSTSQQPLVRGESGGTCGLAKRQMLAVVAISVCTAVIAAVIVGGVDAAIDGNNSNNDGCECEAGRSEYVPRERRYYIAAVEREWDYAPQGINVIMGRPFNEDELVFTENREDRIGTKNMKALYREFDETFTTEKLRPESEEHLGFLGPTVRCVVGDEVVVVFKNMASRNYSIHPHGVFYTKGNEGVPYNDGSSKADKADDEIAPGAIFTYRWTCPERAGPGPNDPSSVSWLYHSHVDEIKDTNSGLVGHIVVTHPNYATDDARPSDVDKEFHALLTVMNEGESHYLLYNVETYTDYLVNPFDLESEDFAESNLKHSINGYLYGNLPGYNMTTNSKVRWYLSSLGTEVDLHTPHWHGQSLLHNGNRVDVVNLLPASMLTLDMYPDNPGKWMFHCHVNDHISAGMQAMFEVTPYVE